MEMKLTLPWIISRAAILYYIDGYEKINIFYNHLQCNDFEDIYCCIHRTKRYWMIG